LLPSGKQLFWLNNIIGPLLFVAVPLGTAPRSGIAIDAKLVVVKRLTLSVFLKYLLSRIGISLTSQ
jgi:hypothetical protein